MIYLGTMNRRRFMKVLGGVGAALAAAPTQLLPPAPQTTVLFSPSVSADLRFRAALLASWQKHRERVEHELIYGAGPVLGSPFPA